MDKLIFTVQWNSDAGHEWLMVAKEACAKIGLKERDFSRYSYKTDNYYYLEGDSDAGFFFEYAHRAGNIELNFLPEINSAESQVRLFPRMAGESLLFEERYSARKKAAIQGAAMD